jgi:hypothetical protein
MTERKPIFNGLFQAYLLNINTLFWSDPVVPESLIVKLRKSSSRSGF